MLTLQTIEKEAISDKTSMQKWNYKRLLFVCTHIDLLY